MMEQDLWIFAGIVFFLLLLSALFSGSETALTAASRARLHRLAQEGDKRAIRVLKLTDDKESLIGAILLGNNLVNILASALTTTVIVGLVGERGVVYATLIMTALVLIFAEVLPKSFAIARSESMALAVAPFIRLLVIVLAPIVGLVQKIVRLTLRLFGVNLDAEDLTAAHEEIRGAIDLHSAEGALQDTDHRMLGGVLDLDDITIEDVMVHRSAMEAIDVNLAPSDIVNEVVKSPYTRLPVYDDKPDNIIGILHAKDVLRALKRAQGQSSRFSVRRVMIKPWYVPETTTLKEQLNAFKERKAHFALVVDEYGDLQGLVTLEDILEEIVGDITDEHDSEVPGVTFHPDGTVDVEGTVTIRDLNKTGRFNLPDEEATTVAGLVLFESETIPIVGQSFTFHGCRFEVTARKRNQITGLRLKKV